MGQAIAITRPDISARELRFIAKRTRGCRVVRRILAIALVLEGVDRATLARSSCRIAKLCETGCIATTAAALLGFLTDVARARSHACRQHNRRGLWLGLRLGLRLGLTL